MASGAAGINPSSLRPGDAIRLLNSTPLGTVTGSARFGERRLEAGMRVVAAGDTGRVNLLRYIAWRFDRLHAQDSDDGEPGGAAGLAGYDAHRERARVHNAALSKLGRDIGPIPEVTDPKRRESAARNFRVFCESYMPATFKSAWSADHLKVITKIQRAVLEGGVFSMAMPRGSGKSCLCEAAAIWALLYGHRRFVACIAADERLAGDMLTSIQSEVETNDQMLADFPEVCRPIRALEGAHQRSAGQRCMGVPTRMQWAKDAVVLPTVEGSKASGSVVRVAGITGRLRGFKHRTAAGEVIRPDLVLIDDPQTDESARSASQVEQRERILLSAVLGLAGPCQPISGLLATTVIQRGDLADRLLDPNLHPQWQGERCKMVMSFPTDQDLWDRYAQLRRQSFASGMSPDEVSAACNEFYAKHRAAMDAGGEVSWKERLLEGNLSALQHAMNQRIDVGDEVFFAEFQNDPAAAMASADESLTVSEVLTRLTRMPRGLVPHGAQCITAFIDVQGRCLFYAVIAWAQDMRGAIIDYGCEPEQPLRYFTLREVQRTLRQQVPSAGLEGAISAGLERLTTRLLGKAWPCDGGGEQRIEKCLIDANWGDSTDCVYQFCRGSPHAAVLMPSHGRGITAGDRPMIQWDKKPGEKVGLNWVVPAANSRRQVRYLLYDANFWKSCVTARLKTPFGDAGSLVVYGDKPEEHRMLADHLTSEIPVLTSGRGRTVSQWELRSVGRDNHLWDCVVGAAVAANMLGVTPPGLPPPVPRKKVCMSEMVEAARERRRRGG